MIVLRFKNYCYCLLFSCIFILGACTKNKETQLVLNIHYPKIKVNLDPHKMEDAYSMMIVTQLYRGLFRFNASGDTMPDLVESWNESKDKKTYRFKLKESTFSNGEKITATHVVYSFARIFILEAGIAADIDYIKGVSQFIKSKDIKDLGIKAISENEVEFELVQPSALFLKHLAVTDCAVMPFNNLKSVTDAPPAYSGPYKVDHHTEYNYDLIKWRKDSEDSLAPPQKIHFFATEENPVDLAKEGKTDTLDHNYLDEKDKEALELKKWGTSTTELAGETFIVLNPKYLNKELRKYLYISTDPLKIQSQVKIGHFKASYGLIPTSYQGELSLSDVADLKKNSSSYQGPKVSFKLDYDPSSPVEKVIADYLGKLWTNDKIKVVLNPLTKREKLQRMFGKKSEAVLGRKGIDYPDGFSVLTYFKGKYDSNYFFVDNPKIDSSIAEALKESDANIRVDLYKKIQFQILKKHTLIPLLFGSEASGLWCSKVKRMPSHPMGYHTIPFETIEMRIE